jgi:hypothetical protein
MPQHSSAAAPLHGQSDKKRQQDVLEVLKITNGALSVGSGIGSIYIAGDITQPWMAERGKQRHHWAFLSYDGKLWSIESN